MRSTRLLLICILLSSSLMAQRLHVGVFGGAAAYNGDLTDKLFPKKVTNGAIGLTLNYEISDQLMLRSGFTYAIVGGADRFSDDPEIVARNLSFETQLYEFSAVGEYYLLNMNSYSRYSPYVFAGLAVYKFNPYAYDVSNQRVFLKPLSTEGQGITGYDTKEYNLTQVAIPVGLGFKFGITDNLRIGIEGGLRKLFTDYLDDVSTNYVDPGDLLSARGQLAVDMSYRGDEVPGGSVVYPSKGQQRGSPKAKDYYYFTGLHLTYRLGTGGGGGFGGGGRKSKTGCPVNVY